MEETKHQYPTEEVTLPSKGLIYPEESPLKKGAIEMKYMTAREEDILTNQNYIKSGIVIDKLLESLIVTPIDYNELLTGDKNAIMVAARILGYGEKYDFKYKNPSTGEHENVTIDLTTIEDKPLNEALFSSGKNSFDFILPASKLPITFKFLTHGDEKAIEAEIKGLKKINKESTFDLSTRMKYIITSINGDFEKATIRTFVDNQLLARDSRALRNHIKEIIPDVDLTFDFEGLNGHLEEKINLPINVNFFWPDASV